MTTSPRLPAKTGWRSILEVVTPVLAVGGLLLFVLVRVYYNQFYGSLGVNPNDLGLGYANTLASSASFILTVVALAVYPSILIVGVYAVIYVLRARKSEQIRPLDILYADFKPRAIRLGTITLPMAMIAMLIVTSVSFARRADHYSDEVKSGRPVKFGGLPLSTLTIRATPARLKTVAGIEGQSEVQALQERSTRKPPLLFLGQANGIIILYDSMTQEAKYVPASLVILELSNCQTRRSPDPDCKDAA
jgi:hypothetical protein